VDDLYWMICKMICLLRQHLLVRDLTSKNSGGWGSGSWK
jgi:hypothetical protein